MDDTKNLIPKFIPLYPAILEHYGIVEASILGYLDFYQTNNKDFSCTNNELSELLSVSEKTISRAIRNLEEKGEVIITKKMREGGGLIRKVSVGQNGILQKVNLTISKMSKGPLHNINQKEEKKEIYKESKIPSVSDLVEAYRNTPALVAKIKDEDVVREFAEYKQSSKKTAYKTVDGFLQKLIAYVNLVSFGEIRYDVGDRLRYALNESRDNSWIKLVWNDEMEQGYQTNKKFRLMTQKQNE